ncbi:hypothetical protein B0A48_14545 [Cryoendolithus antarcticus]|uniref:Enoyl reductase (ER) domain-containing protein n=1 Tax=Cryoendolithus antarcticus TaxID=1507870 RepID=A0A1V8SKT5_9PEZI|nr:hypothetical protein B0A48_14545 [Cryoendolithus antarcticus]
MSVPKEQNAAVKEGFGKESTCKIKRVAVKEPGPGQILVKINWTGLCASDKQLILDEMAALGGKMADSAGGIAGHEGAGTVAAVHPDVADLWKIGDRAGVKWCTFQEYVVTDAKYATSLGHLGIQYAKAMGMRVIAIDGGAAKAELCTSLGAEHYIDFFTTPDLASEVRKYTTYGAHAVVVYASSKESYASAISLLRPRGIVIAVGVPGAPDAFLGTHPAMLAMGAYRTAGSVVGTLKEVDEALDFVKRGLVHPVLTKGTLADVNKYLALMSEGKVAGRVVLKVAA